MLNDDTTKRVLDIRARPGTTVSQSAKGSHDPDGHSIDFSWFVYPEASAFDGEVALSARKGETTSFQVPDAAKPGATIRVILQLQDSGNPSLFAYRWQS